MARHSISLLHSTSSASISSSYSDTLFLRDETETTELTTDVKCVIGERDGVEDAIQTALDDGMDNSTDEGITATDDTGATVDETQTAFEDDTTVGDWN